MSSVASGAWTKFVKVMTEPKKHGNKAPLWQDVSARPSRLPAAPLLELASKPTIQVYFWGCCCSIDQLTLLVWFLCFQLLLLGLSIVGSGAVMIFALKQIDPNKQSREAVCAPRFV